MKHTTFVATAGLLLAASIVLQPVQAARYGPVKSNETLWDIASRYRPDHGVSVGQMMEAFRTKNPHAFVPGHPGLLKRGVYLEIPALAGEPEKPTEAGQQKAAEPQSPPASEKSAGKPDKSASVASLQAEIQTLRTQLKDEQKHSSSLDEQLKQLQDTSKATAKTPADNQQVTKLQSDLLIKLQTDVADLKQQLEKKDARITELQAASAKVAKPEAGETGAGASKAKQANAALQAELTELKQLLEQRDTHIQNLQASLREASISIKRQFTENQELHDQLKTLKPEAATVEPKPPAEPGAAAAPSLTLTAPETEPASVTGEKQAAESTPVFADQIPPAPTNTEDKPQPDKKPVSLQNMLEQQVAGKGGVGTDEKPLSPSRVSVAVALISLMFVLALAWRSYSQQRALRQEETRLRNSLGNDAG
ncbi:FimV/HubP family polar landmark protein [Candidatus Thiothrix sp. Deng01]|uniref:FimV/HubP family polar landmark protein n=1 Tax=Candidatus Thiothrix phosphatis TaxID=3112415 RepID=A0ABU6D3M9_9GAMM|nr:FimV/HubP family polar landmark protein [Candidatus Thiothrix sp. Deng01]MEB4593432.1 FimV/HubP family polar landmark protein [Candidatus Thiothrix sp. Deng01]